MQDEKKPQKEKEKELKVKRDQMRTDLRAPRAALRKRLRGSVAVALAAGMLGVAAACNTATPASKSASSKANDNETTINNYIGLLPAAATNGAAGMVAIGPGGLTISVSDLNGTIVQSADTAGGDRTDLTANPSMAAGITGDKPIDAIQKAVASFASPQDALSATLESLVNKFGFGAATNALVEAASGCASGQCSDPPAK